MIRVIKIISALLAQAFLVVLLAPFFAAAMACRAGDGVASGIGKPIADFGVLIGKWRRSL